MGLRELLESLPERLQGGAHMRTVFGDPITAHGKTILPVARVSYGFGGGLTRKNAERSNPAEPDAGVMGGGVGVMPIGVVEVTEQDTRFISFGENRKVVGSLLLGCCLGYLIGARVVRRIAATEVKALQE